MTIALAFICSALVAVLITKLRAHSHYLLRKAMHRRVITLFADDAQDRAEKAYSDDYEQDIHRRFSFGRFLFAESIGSAPNNHGRAANG